MSKTKMSKIKELKANPENNINYVDLLQGLFPDAKTKYIELLIKLMNNKIKESEYYKSILDDSGGYELSKKIKFSQYTPLEALSLFFTINEFVRMDNLDVFSKFCEFNEKNQIENNDVTAITSFDELAKEVSMVELKSVSKAMQKQIFKLHEDDIWLILKPLTVAASRKYGANTKWCTTDNNFSYFHDYSATGILIYCLNKKTGYKVAMYKRLNSKNPELSFWNQVDARIDSMETELPMEINMILASEAKNCEVTNRALLSDAEKEAENKIFPFRGNEKSSGIILGGEMVERARPAIRIRDAEGDQPIPMMDEPDEGPMDEDMDEDMGREDATDEEVPMEEAMHKYPVDVPPNVPMDEAIEAPRANQNIDWSVAGGDTVTVTAGTPFLGYVNATADAIAVGNEEVMWTQPDMGDIDMAMGVDEDPSNDLIEALSNKGIDMCSGDSSN